MNQNSRLFLLQLILLVNEITAQIQFPGARNTPTAQGTGSAPVYVPNSKVESLLSDLTTINRKVPVASYNEENPESIITRGLTKLTLDINRVVPATSPYLASANNIVYGPLTIAGALELVLLASVGQTFDEIADAMGLSSGLNIQNNPLEIHEHIGRLGAKLASNTGIEIGEQVNYALAIFVQQDYPIRPAFQQAGRQLYGSDIINLDFRGNPLMAQSFINTWVSNRTNAKIPSLLNDFPPPNTRAIIVAVLYFKAAWEFPFFDGHTKWRPFFVNGRKNPSDRMAEMMANGGEFPYYKDNALGAEIMGFPYKGKRSTMYVILPRDSNVEKLRNLEDRLTAADIQHLVNSTRYTEAVVLFPKMKLESTINLKSTLQALGINTLFNPYEANLALLSPGIDQRLNVPEEAPFVSPLAVPAPNNNQRYPQVPQPSRVPSPSRPSSPPRIPQPTRAPTPSRPSITHREPPPQQYPQPVQQHVDERLIFNRFGTQVHCIQFYDLATNSTICQENVPYPQNQRFVRAVPLSARANDVSPLENLESVRRQVNSNPRLFNPGIYADEVIHKVYMDITESGTEAAAATGISLNRSGGRVTFRVDIPFLFFIYNEETKTILFWGSVKSPSPSIATPST